VLVAKKNLIGYARLNDPEAFEVRHFEKHNVTKDVVGDFEKVKGRILKNPLAEGKPLAESDLIDPQNAPVSYRLNPGEVAMAVKVPPEDMVGGFVLPGSRVDVQATQVRTGLNEKPFAKFILQNVEVLAVGQDVQLPDGTYYKETNRVVLRLKHKEAEELAVYQDTGKLRLVLRREDDANNYDTPGASTSPSKPSFVPDGAASNDPQPGNGGLSAPSVPTGLGNETGDTQPKTKKNSLTIVNGNVKKFEYKDTVVEEPAPPAPPAPKKQ
jgi:Flp pilus assembly protein CpaB